MESQTTVEMVSPEVITSALSLGMLALGMAYSASQKDWFRRVFKGKCQGSAIGMKHECGPDIQLHHIEPQAWGYENLGKIEEQIDTQDNGIYLCGDAHVGKRGTEDCVHTDQLHTLQEFRDGDKQAFDDLQNKRVAMAQSGVIYWNDKWDSNMVRRTKDRVDQYLKRNPMDQFPSKRKRNGNGKR